MRAMLEIPEKNRVVLVEEKSASFSVFDNDGLLLHTHQIIPGEMNESDR